MADYLDPYHKSVQRHGTGFESTLWASPQSQRLRFAVMTQMVFLPGKRVLDAGCGRGDFAAYLLEHEIEYGKFIGIDGVPEVIGFARERGLPAAEFHAADFIEELEALRTGRPQVIAISGSLNTMGDAQVMSVLDAAWEACGEALVFNFLSDRCDPGAPPQDEFARRLNTLRLLDWALAKTWKVAFRQDYFKLGHDATIAMHRA